MKSRALLAGSLFCVWSTLFCGCSTPPSLTLAEQLMLWWKHPELPYKLEPLTGKIAWKGLDAAKLQNLKNLYLGQLTNDRTSSKAHGEIARVFYEVFQFTENPTSYDVLPFYREDKPGGAFANTFPAKSLIRYRDSESQFAELFFQTEKMSRYGKDSVDLPFDSFLSALQFTRGLKTKGKGWQAFVTAVNTQVKKITPNFRKKWDQQNIAIMSRIHAARFRAEPELLLSLISTPAKSIIVETSQDAYWGSGQQLEGENKLGILYMVHRERFWSDFKKAKNAKFDAENSDHIIYLLEWALRYDGGIVASVI